MPYKAFQLVALCAHLSLAAHIAATTAPVFDHALCSARSGKKTAIEFIFPRYVFKIFISDNCISITFTLLRGISPVSLLHPSPAGPCPPSSKE